MSLVEDTCLYGADLGIEIINEITIVLITCWSEEHDLE